MRFFLISAGAIAGLVAAIAGVTALGPEYRDTYGLFAVTPNETTWAEQCIRMQVATTKTAIIWHHEALVDMSKCDRPDVWVTQPVRELRKECPEKKGCTGKFQKLLWSTKNRPPKEGG